MLIKELNALEVKFPNTEYNNVRRATILFAENFKLQQSLLIETVEKANIIVEDMHLKRLMSGNNAHRDTLMTQDEDKEDDEDGNGSNASFHSMDIPFDEID